MEGVELKLCGEHVVDAGVPREVAISPDGRWVAFVVSPVGQVAEHPASALWVSPVDCSARPQSLVTGAGWVSDLHWTSDSSAIFFLSDQAERGLAQLHRIPRSDGEVEVLTRWKGGIRGHLPLADPDHVVVIAADEPTAEQERRVRERDDAQPCGERVPSSRLRLLDLRTRAVRTSAVFDGRHVVEVMQRPDGGPVAVLTWASPTLDLGQLEPALHVLDLMNGSTVDLGVAAVAANSLTWWQRNSQWRLAYLAVTPPGLVGGDAVFDVAVSGEQARVHRNMTAGMVICPTELVQVDVGAPLALFADGVDTGIYRLEPAERRFTEIAHIIGSAEELSVSRRGDVAAAVLSTAAEPKDVHAGPVQAPLARISDVSPQLRRIEWGVQERLNYHAFDGLLLDGLLILPPGRSRHDGPFPLVTLVHGGPHDRYTDSLNLAWHPSGQWLATAGFAVFLPNPRGGQGHGHAFAAMVAGEVGVDEWTDILTGIDSLIAGEVADPDRLGIGGWSHGGFMSAWAIGQTDRFKAALMGAGISDWGMLAATGQEGPFEAALGGSTGWEGPGPHRHDQLSPISFASRIRTPVLILHGQNDTNVPIGQAEYFHRALNHFGVEHDYVTYPRENHSIRERNHQLDVMRRTRAWFDTWLTPTEPRHRTDIPGQPAESHSAAP